MGKGKMKNCKVCGEEIAASAKICPKCGAKNKKPVYKRPWFIILVAVIILAAVMGGAGDSDSDSTKQDSKTADTQKEQEITYTSYDAGQLMDDLNDNALKAEETYNKQYVELTGRLAVIDSEGAYITLFPEDDQYAIVGVTCYIKDDDQKEVIKELSVGDSIIVKGKITAVGEVIGYSLDMDSISKK